MAPRISKQATLIVLAKRKAENGVDYSPRRGARCPWCKGRAKIVKTQKWDGSFRTRYHRCESMKCVLGQMGINIKSIEEDFK